MSNTDDRRHASNKSLAVDDAKVHELVGVTSTSKTFSRILVEKFLIHFRWYNPNAGKAGEDVPDLRKAWAYYEHVSLARYYVNPADNTRFDRADPGESKRQTELYPVMRLPMKQLNDWGIGVGLYFSELRSMMFILFCAGLISVSNILFFSGEDYRNLTKDQKSVSYLISGSAVCNETEWVACEENWCNTTSMMNNDKYNATITTVSVNGVATTLVERRRCDGALFKIGMTNYAAVMFLIVASLFYFYYIAKRSAMLDEDNVTASDYSVVIENPPPDAYNPDEWRDFFAKYADKQVTAITICLNNAALVRSLMARRILLNRIKNFIPNVNFDSEEDIVIALKTYEAENPTKNKILQKLASKLQVMTDKVKSLQKKEYTVKHVFVTFETEEAQRTALFALKSGKLQLWSQLTSEFAPESLFKGKALAVTDAEEPTSIRYLDLQVGFFTSLLQSTFTFILTIGLIALSDYAIVVTRQKKGTVLAGNLTTALNGSIPFILKKLMLTFEQHKSESSWQTSLYLRLTLFRWFNTAILARLYTPFESTLGNQSTDLLPAISGILLSELWLSPLLAYLDLWGSFQKHVVAPRASSQAQMNLAFKGSYYNLAERYTSFTTIVFLCYLYCALNPLSFFICGGILLIQFYMDKFLLTRTWFPAPMIGTKVSRTSRFYFFLALVVCVIICSYDWSRFRYDNVCLSPNFPEFPTSLRADDGTVFDSRLHRVCNNEQCCDQTIWNIPKRKYPIFPLVPRFQPSELKWMSTGQERLSSIYGWTSVGFLAFFLVFSFGYQITTSIISLCKGIASIPNQNQQIDFSCTGERGYVPQHWMFQFDYNLLACELDGVTADLVGWYPPHGSSFDDYNVIFDVPYEGMTRKRNETADGNKSRINIKRPIFSIVKQWPLTPNTN